MTLNLFQVTVPLPKHKPVNSTISRSIILHDLYYEAQVSAELLTVLGSAGGKFSEYISLLGS